MSQGAGNPLEDLEPLVGGCTDMTDQGRVEYVTIGCHKGRFRGFNIRNPEPNYVYKWINNRPEEILQAQQEGRQIIGHDDQEASALEDLLGLEPTPLDGSCMFAGMIAVKTPIEVVRRQREQRERLHKARFKDGSSEREYFDGATEEEIRLGGDQGLRMMRRDHGTEVTEGPNPSGRRLDSWRPNLGLDYRG